MGGIKKHILRDAHRAFLMSENGNISRYKTTKQLQEEKALREQKSVEKKFVKSKANKFHQTNDFKRSK